MGNAARNIEQQVSDEGDVERERAEAADTLPMPALAECGACDGDGFCVFASVGAVVCGGCEGSGVRA